MTNELNFILILPELFVLIMACAVLLVGLFKTTQQTTYQLTLFTLIAALVVVVWNYNQPEAVAFFGHFTHDKLASILKIFILITSAFTVIYSRDYIVQRKMAFSEYHVLILFAVLGMMILVSTQNLITLFLGLELMSLPLYALVALRRDNAIASEAAMKFFILSALASGILLYGLSMLYGLTGTLSIPDIAQAYSMGSSLHVQLGNSELILQFALVFIVVAIAFKFGAVPFHLWVPDVYHGAPTSVTLFIGTAAKVAGIGFALRLLFEMAIDMQMYWQPLFISIAILSIVIGNVVAIAQSNLKRMLAYSSIAHMGYMLLGIIAGGDAGYQAALFYMLVYSIMSLASFGMIVALSRQGFEAEEISNFQGLGKRNPWLAFIMLLIMFSMAGVPPTVGFIAKLYVLQALVSADMVWLAVTALVLAVIGAYYYLRVVKVMYFDQPTDLQPIQVSKNLNLTVSFNGLALLLLGILPSVMMTIVIAV